LLRFFFWILQLRSHFSYSSFMRIVRRKKPWGARRGEVMPRGMRWAEGLAPPLGCAEGGRNC
jgi:hypothetical protein